MLIHIAIFIITILKCKFYWKWYVILDYTNSKLSEEYNNNESLIEFLPTSTLRNICA